MRFSFCAYHSYSRSRFERDFIHIHRLTDCHVKNVTYGIFLLPPYFTTAPGLNGHPKHARSIAAILRAKKKSTGFWVSRRVGEAVGIWFCLEGDSR
jgi:hypothetical protein